MPRELAEISLGPPATGAGGLGAITSALRFVHRDTGFARGTKALLTINQPNGFDCPGCAWPQGRGATLRYTPATCSGTGESGAAELQLKGNDANVDISIVER